MLIQPIQNIDLQILQGKVEGDTYEAANRLASYLTLHFDVNDDGLADWLAEGDYDDDETLNSLVAEWQELNNLIVA